MNKLPGSANKIYQLEYKLHGYLHLLVVCSQESTNHLFKSLHFIRKNHKLPFLYLICGNTSFKTLWLYQIQIRNLSFQNLLCGPTDNNIEQDFMDLTPLSGHRDTMYSHKLGTQDATRHFLIQISPISTKPLHSFILQWIFPKLPFQTV